jgi:hypothetical protein
VLKAEWGAQADLRVARKLGRTVRACRRMATLLGVPRRTNMYTAAEVGGILALSTLQVVRLIERGLLSASRTHFGRRGHRYWRVTGEDLEAFILEQPHRYNAGDIDRATHPYWWNLAHSKGGW